jgi:hypothetical protein
LLNGQQQESLPAGFLIFAFLIINWPMAIIPIADIPKVAAPTAQKGNIKFSIWYNTEKWLVKSFVSYTG